MINSILKITRLPKVIGNARKGKYPKISNDVNHQKIVTILNSNFLYELRQIIIREYQAKIRKSSIH